MDEGRRVMPHKADPLRESQEGRRPMQKVPDPTYLPPPLQDLASEDVNEWGSGHDGCSESCEANLFK